jgi:hypothetical protein
MRKIESSMLQAIQSKKNWKQTDTTVYWKDGIGYVILYYTTIAVIDLVKQEVSIIFSDRDSSVTMSSRIDAVLSLTCNNPTLRTIEGERFICYENGEKVPFIEGMKFELKIGAIKG